MEGQKSKPTIEDVAKHSGVSIATVSRVINQSDAVSKDFELKVRKAVKELGFTPRQWTARAKIETIAIAIPTILNPFYAEIINGAQDEADKQDLNLVILNVAPNQKRQKQYLNLLTQAMFTGLIVVGSRLPPESLVELHEQYKIPIVTAVHSVEIPQFPCIMFDHETPTFQATKILLSLQHSRIAYISGPLEWHSATVRLKGIQRALSEAGLTLSSALHRWCFPNIENGIQMTNNLLSLPEKERPTAIIAFNDLVAFGALHALRIAGLKVPQDISVIGFDDIAMAAYSNPPLTTVSHPKYAMGQLSVQTLTESMNGAASMKGGFTLLECPLVLRESIALCAE